MRRSLNMKYDKQRIRNVIQHHLNEDYRDPTLMPLPPREPIIEESRSCIPNERREDSVKEVVSNTSVWDNMMGVGIFKQKLGRTFTDFRHRQREFIFNQVDISDRIIRRLTIPASKYVLLELKEDGYTYAAYYLQKLINMHDKMRAPIPPEQLVDKPLKLMPKSIVFLGDILKQANIYKNERKIEKELSLYFHVARHYETKDKRYWTWLANEFYNLAVKTVKHFKRDGGYSKAFINYMYGRYLLLKAKSAYFARKRLQIAFDISQGRPWGAMWATNISFEHLNQYSSYLLHIAQLMNAREISNFKPAKAVRFTHEAVRHARRGNWHPDYEEAMMDLAICYTKNKQHDEAINILTQLDRRIKPHVNRDMYISIQVLLALCFKRARRKDEAIKQLFFLAELGREWGIPELVAFGHKYISHYLIEKDRVVAARKYLISCILLYKQQNKYKELLESVYLHGACKAQQHLKQYIELMVESRTPDSPGFKKIFDFLSYGKPFWKVNNLKRFVVTTTVKPLLSHKEVLTASDKVYLLLKNKFGEQFADYAMEEITKYGKKPLPGDQNNYFLEDPTEFEYFETRKEAEAYKEFLKDKYQEKNDRLEKLYGQHLHYEIEEREIENEKEEKEYINSLKDIDPIIPYEKDSPLYKQALNLIEGYLHPHSSGKPKTVYIDVPNPKILIRLLNTIADSGNILFKFQGPIDFAAILQEMIKQREQQKKFVETLPDVLHLRYSTEIPVRPSEPTKMPHPEEEDEDRNEHDSDEFIEQNRDILFNKNFDAVI